MKKLIMALWILTMLALAACGGTTSPTAAPSDGGTTGGDGSASGGPADALRAFMEATYSGDTETMASLYCSEIAPESIPAGMELPEGTTVDISGLTYTVVSESGDTAEVSVAGPVVTTIDVAGTATSSTVDLPATTYPMRNEDGWKICPPAP